jgi:hypothetical protein
MFLSSYAPLFALLAYANRACPTTWHVLAAVAVVSIVGLVVVMVARRNDKGPRLVVAHSRPKDGDVLAYTATYLLPFLGLDLSRSNDIVLLSGFLVVLGVVYINSNMLFVNPLLSLAGYHSFEVIDEDGHEYSVIARRRDLDPGVAIRPSQVDRYVRVEVRP